MPIRAQILDIDDIYIYAYAYMFINIWAQFLCSNDSQILTFNIYTYTYYIYLYIGTYIDIVWCRLEEKINCKYVEKKPLKNILLGNYVVRFKFVAKKNVISFGSKKTKLFIKVK